MESPGGWFKCFVVFGFTVGLQFRLGRSATHGDRLCNYDELPKWKGGVGSRTVADPGKQDVQVTGLSSACRVHELATAALSERHRAVRAKKPPFLTRWL